MELIRGNVKVELEDIGEGWSGDYNPDDPDDTPLLRFTVSKREDGEWQEVDSASYCTRIPVDTDPNRLREILGIIMDRVADAVEQGSSIKKDCEELSWLGA